MKVKLNSNYWDNRYKSNNIGWDIGAVSTPLKSYFDQLEDKNISILIPGAGNGYEASYLFSNGFKNVTIVDYSEEAINSFKSKNPVFPLKQCVCCDFFDLEGQFDLIIEQTFFCALNPNLRSKYVVKMKELLKKKGKLVGLLFQIPLNEDQPPFGGNQNTYKELFQKHFQFTTFETCYNSISPRMGNELFINFVNK